MMGSKQVKDRRRWLYALFEFSIQELTIENILFLITMAQFYCVTSDHCQQHKIDVFDILFKQRDWTWRVDKQGKWKSIEKIVEHRAVIKTWQREMEEAGNDKTKLQMGFLNFYKFITHQFISVGAPLEINIAYDDQALCLAAING